jgi:hypothetical protein
MAHGNASREEDFTPIHCTAEYFLLNRGVDWRKQHNAFLEENNMLTREPASFPLADVRELLTAIQEEKRRLDWFPGEVNLSFNLYQFFLSRRMKFYANLPEEVFSEIHCKEPAWIVSANGTYCKSVSDHRLKVRESGFHDIVVRPDVVQIVYLIALAEFQGVEYAKSHIPYASTNKDKLLFIRTSTVVEINNKRQRLVVAYLPGEAVCVLPISLEGECDNLITPDVFLLSPEKYARKQGQAG